MSFPREKLFRDLLSIPTSPFREQFVLNFLGQVLTEGQVPHFQDPIGNLVVGASSPKEYARLLQKRSEEPVRLFIAHTDHPGFHGEAWMGEELQVRWHGGAPTVALKGARVWLYGASLQKVVYGTISDVTLKAPAGNTIESATIRFGAESLAHLPAKNLFGGFGFRAPLWKEGPFYYTKAADDLVGCFAIVSLALDHFAKKKRGAEFPFLGLLTRAEEVGFIGAIGHFELGWLKRAKRPLLAISLETSRTLPDAEIGKGPIVRLGDRYTVFDAGSLRVLIDLAAKLLPGSHQKRIMDGGSCEATAAQVYGLKTIGLSVPLGNYHNQNLQGGPDASLEAGGPAPEFVHENDVALLLTLCEGLMQPKLPWQEPWRKKAQDFKKSLKLYRPLLRRIP